MSKQKTEKKRNRKGRTTRVPEIKTMVESKESRDHRLQKELFLSHKDTPLKFTPLIQGAPNKILHEDAELSYLLKQRDDLIERRQEIVEDTQEKTQTNNFSPASTSTSFIATNLKRYQKANAALKQIDLELTSISDKFFNRLALLPSGLEKTDELIKLLEKSRTRLIATINSQLNYFAKLKFTKYSTLEANRKTVMEIAQHWLQTLQESKVEIDKDILNQLEKLLDLNHGRTTTVFISHDTERQVLPLDECKELVEQLFVKSSQSDTPCNEELTRQIMLLRSCENLLRRIPIKRLQDNLKLIATITNEKEQFDNASQQTKSILAALHKSYKQICLSFTSYSPQPYEFKKLTATLHEINNIEQHVKSINQSITATFQLFTSILDDVDNGLPLHSNQAKTSLKSCHSQLTQLLESRQTRVAQLTVEIGKANESLKDLFDEHDSINRHYFDTAYQHLDNTLIALKALYPSVTTAKLVVEKTGQSEYSASLNTAQLSQNAKSCDLNDFYREQLAILSDEYATFLDRFEDETTTLHYKKTSIERISSAADKSIKAIFSQLHDSFRQDVARLRAHMIIYSHFIAESISPLGIELNETALEQLQSLNSSFSDLRHNLGHAGFSLESLHQLCSPYTRLYSNRLAHQLNGLHSHYITLIAHDQRLDNIQVKQLQRWLDESDSLENNTHNCQERTKTAFQNLIKAEAKVRCPTFQLSLNLIKQLDEEIIRIMRKHISARINDVNPQFRARYNDLNEILHQEDLSSAEIKQQAFAILPKEFTKQFVNSIDNRISRLMTIKDQFKQLNRQFINGQQYSEDRFYPTEQSYRDGLNLVVRNTLFHDHMEDMSDGKRSKFTQWLRRKLLKPLQNSTNWINRFIHRNDEHFFAAKKCTWGAYHTERVLVQMGNNYYRELSPPATIVAPSA